MTASPPQPIAIAMWSGPRNVSTALMRSFGSRADTAVVDEPLYAHYLAETGLPHPLAQEVLAHHERDWRKVADTLTGPAPDGAALYYQKHMAHHLLPQVGRQWLAQLRHAFLIRAPDEMLASLSLVTPDPDLSDTGLPQQLQLFEETAARQGCAPAVVDGADLLADPPGVLAALCRALGIGFDPAMLSWQTGLRDTDGIWAPAWYDAVAASTGFAPPRPRQVQLKGRLEELHQRCLPLYRSLHSHRITA